MIRLGKVVQNEVATNKELQVLVGDAECVLPDSEVIIHDPIVVTEGGEQFLVSLRSTSGAKGSFTTTVISRDNPKAPSMGKGPACSIVPDPDYPRSLPKIYNAVLGNGIDMPLGSGINADNGESLSNVAAAKQVRSFPLQTVGA